MKRGIKKYTVIFLVLITITMPSLAESRKSLVDRVKEAVVTPRPTLTPMPTPTLTKILEPTLTPTNRPTDPVFSMFRNGDFRGAANYCIKEMGFGNATKTNLAFLLRYGHLSKKDLDSDDEYSIPDLLAEGVNNQESYALLNMALYELELKHYSQAESLLDKITEEGWHKVSERFWYPELWERFGDSEGALVCVLAHVYGNCDFDDYEEMLESVKFYYGGLVDVLDTVFSSTPKETHDNEVMPPEKKNDDEKLFNGMKTISSEQELLDYFPRITKIVRESGAYTDEIGIEFNKKIEIIKDDVLLEISGNERYEASRIESNTIFLR